jgi:hypothetical protein
MLPGPDSQLPPSTPPQRRIPSAYDAISVSYSMPPDASTYASSASSPLPSSSGDLMDREHALDFAIHSWDLATGGLKTLTAKREFSLHSQHRVGEAVPDFAASLTRTYTIALIVMVCVLLMLIGGGIMLFMMLQ